MAPSIRFARMVRKAASLARCSTRPATPLELLGRTGLITPTPREAFRHILTGKASYTTASTSRAFGPPGPDGLPCYVDWRLASAVTDVMEQGYCGCCWARAAVATIEAVNFKATDHLVKLPVQQLIDCVDVHADVCHGGSVEAAYRYVINNGGLVTDADYPFEMRKNYVYKPIIVCLKFLVCLKFSCL